MLHEAGVVVHQFDGYEAAARPWAPCSTTGHGDRCGGGELVNRMSAMLIFKEMRDRRDRIAVPLTSARGGVVVRPTVAIRCAFGDDGTTWEAPDGCWPAWCDRNRPHHRVGDPEWAKYAGEDGFTSLPCGFGPAGQVHASWRPADLDVMLSLYRTSSQPYKAPAFYSGYNELVYSSEDWNGAMPSTIEAFFTQGQWDTPQVKRLHQAFLRQYRLSAAQVPLLQFDPANWETPFAA